MDLSKILIVDDEVDLIDLLVMILEGKGFEVKTANNGQEALEVLKSYNPFLVITDMNMPKMNGLELLREAKETLKLDSEFIFITGFDGYTKDMIQGLGGFTLLDKPFEFNDLFDCIKSVKESFQKS